MTDDFPHFTLGMLEQAIKNARQQEMHPPVSRLTPQDKQRMLDFYKTHKGPMQDEKKTK